MYLAQAFSLPGTDSEGNPTPIEISGPENFPFQTVGDILSKLLPILLTLAGLILFVYLIWGGFDYLLSGGDQAKMEKGKQKLTHAVIGFVLVFISYFLTQLLCFLFGCSLF